eukprot:1158122-Pelagomonas_calceolata.AAC.6
MVASHGNSVVAHGDGVLAHGNSQFQGWKCQAAAAAAAGQRPHQARGAVRFGAQPSRTTHPQGVQIAPGHL